MNMVMGVLVDMDISILWLKKTLNIVAFLLLRQPPCAIIRTTADFFFLLYIESQTAM
jgi:hypothetical protein